MLYVSAGVAIAARLVLCRGMAMKRNILGWRVGWRVANLSFFNM